MRSCASHGGSPDISGPGDARVALADPNLAGGNRGVDANVVVRPGDPCTADVDLTSIGVRPVRVGRDLHGGIGRDQVGGGVKVLHGVVEGIVLILLFPVVLRCVGSIDVHGRAGRSGLRRAAGRALHRVGRGTRPTGDERGVPGCGDLILKHISHPDAVGHASAERRRRSGYVHRTGARVEVCRIGPDRPEARGGSGGRRELQHMNGGLGEASLGHPIGGHILVVPGFCRSCRVRFDPLKRVVLSATGTNATLQYCSDGISLNCGVFAKSHAVLGSWRSKLSVTAGNRSQHDKFARRRWRCLRHS